MMCPFQSGMQMQMESLFLYENFFSCVDVFVFSLVDIQLSLRCGCVTSSHREGASSETILDSTSLILCSQIKIPSVYHFMC